MNKTPSIAFAVLAAVLTPLPTATAAMTTATPLAAEPAFQTVQADCSAAARQVVAETGGQLLSVAPSPDGSCDVTVLVPGENNERPRRVTVNVPG